MNSPRDRRFICCYQLTFFDENNIEFEISIMGYCPISRDSEPIKLSHLRRFTCSILNIHTHTRTHTQRVLASETVVVLADCRHQCETGCNQQRQTLSVWAWVAHSDRDRDLDRGRETERLSFFKMYLIPTFRRARATLKMMFKPLMREEKRGEDMY